jgi:hypothetical protein
MIASVVGTWKNWKKEKEKEKNLGEAEDRQTCAL